MREAPLDRNEEAFQFAEKLFAGGFDMVVLLTGVGTRLLDQVLSTRFAPGRFADALRGVTVVARGPKPMAVLRDWNVPAILVPEPNTWREVLASPMSHDTRHVKALEFAFDAPLEHWFGVPVSELQPPFGLSRPGLMSALQRHRRDCSQPPLLGV